MAASNDIRAGGAFVEAYLKDAKLDKGLKAAQAKVKAFGASVTAIGEKIFKATSLAILPLGAVAVKNASDLEETMNKFNVVFGNSAAEMKKWGDAFAAEVGRSKQQVADFLGGTQDLFVPLGFEAGAAAEMSKQLTGLAIDLASFNNIADADALRDLHAALTGSGEVMKKYGVIVSEAAVKQELLRQSIDPSAATEQQKVMARLNIILAGTTAAQGDAIRSADGFANQLKRLQGELKDATAEIGSALLPALSQAAAILARVASVIGQWAAENPELIQQVTKIAAATLAGSAALMVLGKTLGLVSSAIGLVRGAAAGVVKVLGLIAAHPAIAALSLAAAGITQLSGAFASAATGVEDFAASARAAREAGQSLRREHIDGFTRLKALSDRHKLTNAEMTEAKTIIDGLTAAYGDLGISLDETTGKLTGVSEAQKKLQTAMQAKALAEANIEYMQIAKTLNELKREEKKQSSSLTSKYLPGSTAQNNLLNNIAQQIIQTEKLKSAQTELIQAMHAGQADAIATPAADGGGGQQAAVAEAAAQRDLADALTEAADAREDIAKFHEDRRREGMTDVERRIDDVRKETEAYKDALVALMDTRRFDSDEELNAARKMLADQLAEADKLMQDRIGEVNNAEWAANRAKKQEFAAGIGDQLGDAQIDLDVAKGAITPLEAELKKLDRERAAAMQDAIGQGFATDELQKLFDVKKQLLLAGDAASEQFAAAGTFSAMAASRMGAGGPAERLEKLNQDMLRELKKIANEAEGINRAE